MQMYTLKVLEVRNLKSRRPRAAFPLENPADNASPCFSQILKITCIPWFTDPYVLPTS